MMKRGVLASAVLLLAAYGCEKPNPYKLQGAPPDCPPPPVTDPSTGSGNNLTSTGSGAGSQSSGAGASSGTGGGNVGTELDDRVIDFNEALRTASLKLTGNLPSLDDIYALADADEEDKPALYRDLIDAMLATPQFKMIMVEHFRETFHLFDDTAFDFPQAAGALGMDAASRDSAAIFAAYLLSENQDFRLLLTADGTTVQTCPTFDPATGVFTPGDCNNKTSLTNASLHPVGMLTDPGALQVYYGNLGFRRNRFIQETFLCRFAIEPVAEPADPGQEGDDIVCAANGGTAVTGYINKWDMGSISGSCNTSKAIFVDFQAWNSAVTCANCHATWNHRAPMFGKFDANGAFVMGAFGVNVPVEGVPVATLEDWLPTVDGDPNTLEPGIKLAWRYNYDLASTEPGAALMELGPKMVTDPDVQSCMVKRAWNLVMTRGDIVYSDAQVPDTVLKKVRTLDFDATDIADPYISVDDSRDLLAEFESSEFHLKDTLRTVLLSEDFTKF